jgi:membrane protease subunit HflK
MINRVKSWFGGLSQGSGGGVAGNVGASGRNFLPYLVFGLIGVAFVAWMATGIYQVSPGEQAAHRTFGKCCRVSAEGLNWWWPAPIGTKNIESVEEIREMKLGFAEEGRLISDSILLLEARMIAGDLNLVVVPLVVQYRIKNLENFLFKVSDPGETIVTRGDKDIAPDRPEGRTLKDATEAALRLVVGQRSIDDVLTENKTQVQEDTLFLLQEILDNYGAGIEITAVLLQEVSAPEEVRDAFQDVNRARQDRDTLINQAEAFERDIIPRARGQAERIVQAAEAFKRERIANAEGEASRFLSILREYQKSRDVTRQRLYLEAMEDILANVAKFVVSPDVEGSIILNAGSGVVPVPDLSSVPGNIQPAPTTETSGGS